MPWFWTALFGSEHRLSDQETSASEMGAHDQCALRKVRCCEWQLWVIVTESGAGRRPLECLQGSESGRILLLHRIDTQPRRDIRCNCEKFRAELLNHLVRDGEQSRWHGQAEHPCGIGVDDQFEFRRLHDRQVRRLNTLEDAAGVGADQA